MLNNPYKLNFTNQIDRSKRLTDKTAYNTLKPFSDIIKLLTGC